MSVILKGELPLAEDHRVRVARNRRDRMRAQILNSVMAVYSRVGFHNNVVINDIIAHAKISRGTFYKYFDSLEEAVSALGQDMADEMTQGILSVYDVLDDPILRTATGFQTFLVRATFQPNWGGFIGRIGLLSSENLLTHKIQADIQLGVDRGVYRVKSIDTATDLLMGAKKAAMLRIDAGDHDGDYVQTVTAMVLQAFGVRAKTAERQVRIAYDRLMLEAPGTIDWWPTEDTPAVRVLARSLEER
jgi:AcrR family transcriptional regulator